MDTTRISEHVMRLARLLRARKMVTYLIKPNLCLELHSKYVVHLLHLTEILRQLGGGTTSLHSTVELRSAHVMQPALVELSDHYEKLLVMIEQELARSRLRSLLVDQLSDLVLWNMIAEDCKAIDDASNNLKALNDSAKIRMRPFCSKIDLLLECNHALEEFARKMLMLLSKNTDGDRQELHSIYNRD